MKNQNELMEEAMRKAAQRMKLLMFVNAFAHKEYKETEESLNDPRRN